MGKAFKLEDLTDIELKAQAYDLGRELMRHRRAGQTIEAEIAKINLVLEKRETEVKPQKTQRLKTVKKAKDA